MEQFLETYASDILTEQERNLSSELWKANQGHVFDAWPSASPAERRGMMEQLVSLDKTTPGGLLDYVRRARSLLQDSLSGRNPLEGWVPTAPDGVEFNYGSAEFTRYEDLGLAEANKCAFVLVAGGLGERLGYSHIKVSLPCSAVRDVSFLQFYAESLLALQSSHGPSTPPIPLAIMTSDDTHAATVRMLEENQNFGLDKGQVTLIKQEKVPCLADNEARLALDHGNMRVMTKPHGHGDVHSLLHSSGLVGRWHAEGRTWVCFFQDTNGLVFRGLIAALGVSAAKGYDMNSQTVPRRAKEAIGAICRLVRPGSAPGGEDRALTINVEYNQLDPMLRGCGAFPEGDVNGPNGLSPFPGNINQLVIRLAPYKEALDRTGGVVAEFVNPKYKDASKSEFKAPTRLECMMQDLPHSLPPTARVGYTQTNETWAAYSPVKNSPQEALKKVRDGCPSHSATAAEFDLLRCNCEALRAANPMACWTGTHTATFNGLDVEIYPQVAWSPSFALTVSQVRQRVQGPVRLTGRSTLVLEGNVTINGLDLDGALVVRALNGSTVELRDLLVRNDGWLLLACGADEPVREEDVLRGFKAAVEDQEEFSFDDGKHHVITGPIIREPKKLSGSPIADEILSSISESLRSSVRLSERLLGGGLEAMFKAGGRGSLDTPAHELLSPDSFDQGVTAYNARPRAVLSSPGPSTDAAAAEAAAAEERRVQARVLP